jgi:plasmid maintenance system antidote protein VapI
MGGKPKTVSTRIRDAVGNGEVSRYRIALDCGISESSLSRFVAGEQGLSMQAIDTLAEYFGLELTKRKPRGRK